MCYYIVQIFLHELISKISTEILQGLPINNPIDCDKNLLQSVDKPEAPSEVCHSISKFFNHTSLFAQSIRVRISQKLIKGFLLESIQRFQQELFKEIAVTVHE